MALYFKLGGRLDSQSKFDNSIATNYGPEHAVFHRNACFLAFRRVIEWSNEIGIEKLLRIRDCLFSIMFSGMKLSEFISATMPDIEIPAEILGALENLLIRAELTQRIHRKPKNLLTIIFKPHYDESMHSPLDNHSDFVVPARIQTESLLALQYFMSL